MQFSILESLNTPMFWVNSQGVIRWRNQSAAAAIANLAQDNLVWLDICNTLPKGYIYRLHENVPDGEPGVLVECIPDTNPELIFEIQRLQSANDELERIFDASFDEVFVTDGQGITLRVNETVERLYGISRDELIGKSVFELEHQRVFYPSVTAMVLREKKRITAIQMTNDGRRLIATANPVFDSIGNIIQVISNAKDISDIGLPTGDVKAIQTTIQGTLSQVAHQNPGEELFTQSPRMKPVLDLIKKVKDTDTSVLLLGETGVGKNRFAEWIHQTSRRNNEPFVHIDCASIPETLLESELFGYEKGAFTGANREGKLGSVELADGGTLFLDEIGEIPLHLQGKLLNFIQKRMFTRIGGTRLIAVNTRMVAATNRDLEQMVAQGQFRGDLYYRLNVIPILIPPLRERKDDILTIASQLLVRFSEKYNLPIKRLHKTTAELLSSYSWPGNIRQLENVMERLVITIDQDTIDPCHLPSNITHSGSVQIPSHPYSVHAARIDSTAPDKSLREQVAQFEKQIFEQARTQFHSTYAIAKELDVSQPTVVRKLKQYGLK